MSRFLTNDIRLYMGQIENTNDTLNSIINLMQSQNNTLNSLINISRSPLPQLTNPSGFNTSTGFYHNQPTNNLINATGNPNYSSLHERRIGPRVRRSRYLYSSGSVNPPANNYNNLSPVIVRPTQEQIQNATRELLFSSIQQPYNRLCPIMQQGFLSADNVVQIISCGHIFTPSALHRWFQLSPRCPLCRIDIRDHDSLEPLLENNNNTNTNTSSLTSLFSTSRLNIPPPSTSPPHPPSILSSDNDTPPIPNTSPPPVFSTSNVNNIIDNVYTHYNNPLWSGTFNQITDNLQATLHNTSFDSSSNLTTRSVL
jgi:hypothetical protein